MSALRSIWIWMSAAALIVAWLPLLATIRVFDRDPVRYTTGLWFRRLGAALTKVNPSWRVHITGERISSPRNPYVVVSNHLSLADIPILSNVPWEMKWFAKSSLFRIPVAGWMMRMAGDIPVDRGNARSGARALVEARGYLQNRYSVMIFPEGTRSADGRIGRFSEGAFHLAISQQVPILPIAIDGSDGCLPKKSWRFGPPRDILVHVFPPVETEGLVATDASALCDRVRFLITTRVAEWRRTDCSTVDALHTVTPLASVS